MNIKLLDAIANAVLYEGYMLYPYRPSSAKNRQRFNFGVLYPQAYSEAQSGSDAWSMQTEFLVQGCSLTMIEVQVRFLHLLSRSNQRQAAWLEGVERTVTVPVFNMDTLCPAPFDWAFAFDASQKVDPSGVVRTQDAVEGSIEVACTRLQEALFKIRIRVKNLVQLDGTAAEPNRDQILLRSFASAHTLLGVTDGQFVSLLEPPEELRELTSQCENVGTWPVLVGDAGQRDTMLSSPIILYDYPQIAPESPGDLFDGTEIDEILALRILTMTDDEKQEARQSDERARQMLERTENLPMEHLIKLHGTLRELRTLKEETP
jgi:hydrogenase maturation protease